MSVKLVRTPDGGFDLSDERGRIITTYPHPNVSSAVLTGHSSGALLAESLRLADEYAATHPGALYIFSDTSKMDGHDRDNLKVSSTWFKANSKRITLFVSLFSNTLNAVAGRLLGMMTGMPTKTYTDPLAFQAFLEEIVRTQPRAPSLPKR